MKVNVNKVELKLTDTDDPIANKIEWTPIKGGGSNFISSKLCKDENTRLTVKPSREANMYFYAFFGTGIAVIAICVIALIFTGRIELFGVFFGLGFTVLPIIVFANSFSVYQFNKNSDSFSETRMAIFNIVNKSKLVNERLSEIHALQVIGEYIPDRSDNDGGRTTDYKSFEVNAVMKDGRRINFLDHAGVVEIRAKANEIASFLNIPIWDAT